MRWPVGAGTVMAGLMISGCGASSIGVLGLASRVGVVELDVGMREAVLDVAGMMCGEGVP